MIREWIKLKCDGWTVKFANVTFLRGNYDKLLSAQQLKSAHHSSSEASILPLQYDLEDFYEMYTTPPYSIVAYTWPHTKFQSAFSYKQLPDTEIEEFKAYQHLKERKEQGWTTHESLDPILSLLERSDPKYEYIQCENQRFTFLVQSEDESSDESTDESTDEWSSES